MKDEIGRVSDISAMRHFRLRTLRRWRQIRDGPEGFAMRSSLAVERNSISAVGPGVSHVSDETKVYHETFGKSDRNR
jgi:hypothetical protein